MRTFADLDQLCRSVGEHIGHSAWYPIDQGQIDRFADVTEDHQWIHTDPTRAAEGPFGATVAHGYLLLALIPHLMGQVVSVKARGMGVNYGLDRVRFPAPVRAGSRIRASAELIEAKPVSDAVHVVYRVTIEIEDGAKPACVADTVARIYR